jgi:hypothetical protein
MPHHVVLLMMPDIGQPAQRGMIFGSWDVLARGAPVGEGFDAHR